MIALLSSVFGGAVNKVASIGIMAALVFGAVVLIYTSGERSAKSADAVKAITDSEKALKAREEVQNQISTEADSPSGRGDIDKQLRKESSRD